MTAAVEPSEWVAHHNALSDRGFTVLDFFCVHCDGAEFVVTTRVLTESLADEQVSRTELAAGEILASLTDVYPAARWHEQEAFELFGIEIDGARSTEVLLWDANAGPPPLAASTALQRRLTAWPGEYEPGPPKRRKKATPGVRPEWVNDD